MYTTDTIFIDIQFFSSQIVYLQVILLLFFFFIVIIISKRSIVSRRSASSVRYQPVIRLAVRARRWCLITVWENDQHPRDSHVIRNGQKRRQTFTKYTHTTRSTVGKKMLVTSCTSPFLRKTNTTYRTIFQYTSTYVRYLQPSFTFSRPLGDCSTVFFFLSVYEGRIKNNTVVLEKLVLVSVWLRCWKGNNCIAM